MGGGSEEDDPPASKRKLVQKSVVAVKIEASSGKQKGEGPPSDPWSWRKYGQKPIKGSPHPRGYYKCSTCKGCPAKKQVERCRTDASLVIITYTSNHNHPGPDISSIVNSSSNNNNNTPTLQSSSSEEESKCTEDITKQVPPMKEEAVVQQSHDHLSILFDEEGPLPYPHNKVASSLPSKLSEENDFFDELEELPITSSLYNLVRSNLFDERILLLPS